MGILSSEQHLVNPLPLPLLCEISGAQPGLTAGRQTEIQVNFEIFKVGCSLKYSICRFM